MPRKQFEYDTARIQNDSNIQQPLRTWLNKAGVDGWELCGIEAVEETGNSDRVSHYNVVLKRELP